MSASPVFSVILISYNHERYIAHAIESILEQTYRNFELIIVDDGSSDKSMQIIDNFSDDRIIICQQKNQGPSEAINSALLKCKGQYIALMSSDDISEPHRLESQMHQIHAHEADMVFSLPKIIGPNSENLSNDHCSYFFKNNFEDTASLYKILFEFGNFLCAPSCCVTRTALEKTGLFRRGLIQLQDFDYWVRACKNNLKILLFQDPLIKYRYLYGENLSNKANINRIIAEKMVVYRDFFDNVPLDLLNEAFNPDPLIASSNQAVDFEVEKALLLLGHADNVVRTVGVEKVITLLDNDEAYKFLVSERGFDLSDFFESIKLINVNRNFLPSKAKQMLDYFDDVLIQAERGRNGQVETSKKIKDYLDNGEPQKAIRIARRSSQFHPRTRIIKIIRRLLAEIREKSKKFIAYQAKKGLIVQPISVFPLISMYSYAQEKNLIVYQEQPETVFLEKPRFIGKDKPDTREGQAVCPRAYICELLNANVTGDANLVISRDGFFLNDELVEFPSADFGTKSPYIHFRNDRHVIMTSKKFGYKKISQGILISCDHNRNYFHWLVEALPKLLFMENVSSYRDYPLLIPAGLHPNLYAALEKMNIHNHPVIHLREGDTYQVANLVYPSPLSRVLDRYGGDMAFDQDIVLSHQWIHAASKRLRGLELNGEKPWRKLFLTRRSGIREVANLLEIEQALLEKGFEVIDLNGFSFDAQIALFRQASFVVAPTGAALTNMLFCQPGVKVVVFMSDHANTNFYMWTQLANIMGLDLQFILGKRLFNLTNTYSVHDDYELKVNEILKYF